MARTGWAATAADVLGGIDLTGKRLLVTGVSSGIGAETARALICHGGEVVGAVRNVGKACEVMRGSEGALSFVPLDLLSLASVRACADALLTDGRPFDLIIANAGMMASERMLTEDGIESQFAGNFLGHFLLVNRLAGLLSEGGRVVNLSSVAHRFGDVDLDDIQFQRRAYDVTSAYAAAKTATVLFTVEFDRRHRARGVRAIAVHPGAVGTALAGSMSAEVVAEMMAIMVTQGAEPTTAAIKTAAQGAATTLWAGIVAPAAMIGGRYCEDCSIAPVSASGGNGVQPYAVDLDRARRLWAIAEDLVGEHFGPPA